MCIGVAIICECGCVWLTRGVCEVKLLGLWRAGRRCCPETLFSFEQNLKAEQSKILTHMMLGRHAESVQEERCVGVGGFGVVDLLLVTKKKYSQAMMRSC